MSVNPAVTAWDQAVQAICVNLSFPLPWQLISAQIDLESAGDAAVISAPTDPTDPSTVGVGLMQITPKWAYQKLGMSSWEDCKLVLLNPFFNLYVGIGDMVQLYRSNNLDYVKALEAYNTGNPDSASLAYSNAVLSRFIYYSQLR